MFTDVWADIGVSSDVLFQHAWLLATNATLATDVLSPASTSHIDVLLIGPVASATRAETKDLDNLIKKNPSSIPMSSRNKKTGSFVLGFLTVMHKASKIPSDYIEI